MYERRRGDSLLTVPSDVCFKKSTAQTQTAPIGICAFLQVREKGLSCTHSEEVNNKRGGPCIHVDYIIPDVES